MLPSEPVAPYWTAPFVWTFVFHTIKAEFWVMPVALTSDTTGSGREEVVNEYTVPPVDWPDWVAE